MLRHALPIAAHLDWALAVTFSAPAEALLPLVSSGLVLDTHHGHGFLAVACVQTRALRPAFLPEALGLDSFLAGYRLFVRFASASGHSYRGLQVLGSETDRRAMVVGGNWLTHYSYRKVSVDVRRAEGLLRVATSSGLALRVREDRAGLPAGSVFATWDEARRFAGPMPFTFAREGRRIVRVEGVREHWQPRAVALESASVPFLVERLGRAPAPAAAFLVEDVAYRWKAGVRERAA